MNRLSLATDAGLLAAVAYFAVRASGAVAHLFRREAAD